VGCFFFRLAYERVPQVYFFNLKDFLKVKPILIFKLERIIVGATQIVEINLWNSFVRQTKEKNNPLYVIHKRKNTTEKRKTLYTFTITNFFEKKK